MGLEGRERVVVVSVVEDVRFRNWMEVKSWSEEGYVPGTRSPEWDDATTILSSDTGGARVDLRGEWEEPLMHVSGEHSLAWEAVG
jgi:hypothetical protein